MFVAPDGPLVSLRARNAISGRRRRRRRRWEHTSKNKILELEEWGKLGAGMMARPRADVYEVEAAGAAVL